MSKEVAEEYASSLSDLTVNSKPLINMLTILAEENVDHAGVIVETVEKHLEKVNADIKLPVLYLVDSIIKNVGGAYTHKFSQIIVNMFTRTFKQVDEKIRAQMFKLRETWHEVFPATKLYQLDVKVNLIDPAWPIQAQPQQSNIHVNPNFLKKPAATVSTPPVMTEEEKLLVAKTEQELIMLQRKRLEIELEQAKRQLEIAGKNVKKAPVPVVVNPMLKSTPPTTTVLPPVPVPVVIPPAPAVAIPSEQPVSIPIKQRLGPPVSKNAGARIAPVSGALAAARRDPRLERRGPPTSTTGPTVPSIAPIAPNVFDIKPLERVTKRKNVITIDVKPDAARRDPRRDPRGLRRRDDRSRRSEQHSNNVPPPVEINKPDPYIERLQLIDPRKINKLPPIPKISREDKDREKDVTVPVKRKKETPRVDKKKRRDFTNNKGGSARDVMNNKDGSSRDVINNKDGGVRIVISNKDCGAREVINNKDGAANDGRNNKDGAASDVRNTKDGGESSKNSSSGSSPEKKLKRDANKKMRQKEQKMDIDPSAIAIVPSVVPAEPEIVPFKPLNNYHKERYMRRNKEKSESPEKEPEPEKVEEKAVQEPSNMPEILDENKDVDFRVLPPVEVDVKVAPITQKRSSTDALESKPKKSKPDKFDILFGSEDVDLRQLPQVEETIAPPPPIITELPREETKIPDEEEGNAIESPPASPKQKHWTDVSEKSTEKTPSKLDLVRAKLADVTKGKDRLGRPLLFSKSPSIEKERRRTLSSEDTDMRNENSEDYDPEDHKKTISIIMSQAKEQFSNGHFDKNQYNALMFQVLQLNEKFKLKEAKQRESLEISKRKLKASIEDNKARSKSPEHNNFGDIDERVPPPVFKDTTPPDSQKRLQDLDMRMHISNDIIDGQTPISGMIPLPPAMPIFVGPGPFPQWRGQFRPRIEEFGPRRMRNPAPPFFRGKFDKRLPRPPMMPIPLPAPKIGICQGEYPLQPYERTASPPPLGAPGYTIPQTDFRVIEYIDQDPTKTIQIDGIPREIRFYGNTAVIMLDWDDPREIKFLPGSRRITFDNKDSVVLSFNEGYKQVEIDDQVFEIKYGAPTRELFINERWFECFFGGQPLGILIDGKPWLILLEGPLPQVDIGKTKRTDLVAGKINLIVDGTQMCPVFLDAKVQKFQIDGNYFTVRFVDALRTVLINEQPFKVEFGGLPKPIYLENKKHFIRFTCLPRHVKPGHIQIANMEGSGITIVNNPVVRVEDTVLPVESEQKVQPQPNRTPSPEGENQGLDMLASLMPSSMAPSSGSEYLSTEPLFLKPDNIPGLETPSEEKPPEPVLPILGNINVNDLFAKLVATGIVQLSTEKKEEVNEDKNLVKEVEQKSNEDKSIIHKVDLLKSETLKVKQPGLVAKLYGGMQCSGCGARFPPEHTVRYSQHLDWHFRQNRRERDSARRAHSRHWHYDLSDWVQYEEVEDLEEREKSWFETTGAEGEAAALPCPEETPSVPAGAPAAHYCALCGDKFDQFYNEDKEEWHLRRAVTHEELNYHPQCFEDYKASQLKEEAPKLDVVHDEVEPVPVDKVDEEAEPIEIKDLDDVIDQSDNESVVEVVETVEEPTEEPLDIDAEEEGDEDDVIYKAEPVEQVLVEDQDTDDETSAERAERDNQAKIDFANVKVKQEPVDPDDEPIITAEVEPVRTQPDTTQSTVLSSIDGNLQLEAPPAPHAPLAAIRINITKTLPTFITNTDDKVLEDISADDEPLPPGEEPELVYTLKPSLAGVQFSRQPPQRKGTELSGLCSVM